MKNLIKVALIGALLAASTVMAQTQLRVATGGPKGNYHRMFTEFQQVCKDQIMQIEVPSKGSVDNMDKLLGNEVNAVIVQTDVLFYRARNEDLGGIKTLFSLYPEEVHVVTEVVSPIKTGGMMGIGSKSMEFNTFADLAGQKVAAWGGSIVTAQFIRLQSEINFQIVEVNDFADAQKKLNSGEVAAFLMVGGQPMDEVKSLPKTYKLLPFSDALVSKLKSVYVPAKLNYSNLGMGGSGVPTIATEALFVTRAYKSEKYAQALAELRGCFKNNLVTLQETTGYHKKWASVNADNTGKWSYYELPATTVKKTK
jgi:hypothetical protein